MLDKLFFLSLVLNASGLFRFVAPQLGVTIGQVSLVLLAYNVFYLLAKAELTIPILLRGAMGRWLLILLFWPLMTLFYAPAIDAREIGLIFYAYTLFLGVVVYTCSCGLPAMFRMLTVTLLITIIGIPLSVKAPEYFEAVAVLADGKAEEMGRPIGFFMQPNRLARNVCFMFIGWFALWPNRSILKEALAVVAFLALELVTGSRSGVLVGVGVIGILLAYRWPERLRRGRLLRTGGILLILFLAGLAGVRLYITEFADPETRRHGDLIDRMESMITLRFSPEGDLSEDVSLQARLAVQAHYVDYISARPFTGYGFASDVHYVESGTIWKSAHSQVLSWAFQFGIVYPLAYFLVVFSFYWAPERRRVERALATNSVAQFAASFMVFAAYAAASDGRIFFIVLGLIYALVYYPEVLFAYDTETNQFGDMLTRDQIRMRRRSEPKPLLDGTQTLEGSAVDSLAKEPS